MALTRTSRSVSRMIGRSLARTYVLPNRRQTVADYVVEHKGSQAHRSTERCELCEEHAKNAVPRFSSAEADDVSAIRLREGGSTPTLRSLTECS